MAIASLVLPDAAAAARAAAHRIAAAVQRKPHLVLGLATGETMRPVHAALVDEHRRTGTDYRRVRVFNLDDYVGLPHDHRASFRRFMRETLFEEIGIRPQQADMPDGMAHDLAAEAGRYEAAIAACGGIDLQLLGIGRNGHIAFNEPGSGFGARTRTVTLAATTRAAAARHFAPAPVPEQGLTMGIGTILEARAIMLVATGAAKRASLARALLPPSCEACPASALQTHANITVIADEAAWGGEPA